MSSNGSCKIIGIIELLGINDKKKSIQKLFTKDITAKDGVSINKFISWDDLLAQNAFVEYNSIIFEVKIRVKNETKPVLLVCLICFEDIKSQKNSSLPYGHIFCTECIENSLKLNTACPVYKTATTPKDLRPILLPM